MMHMLTSFMGDFFFIRAASFLSAKTFFWLISVVLFSFIEAQELIFLHRRDHNWWPGSSFSKAIGDGTETRSIV